MRTFAPFAAGASLALAFGWLALPRVLYSRQEQPLRFSHLTHTSEKTGLGCQDCHAVREDGRFAGIPGVESCAACHSEPQGSSADEKRLVEEFVKPGREILWQVYARQPDNVRFPHVVHTKRAALACERCHGSHGKTDALRPLEQNRVSGYSRDVEGEPLALVGAPAPAGMKMSECERCHAEHGRARTSCLACHS